jgi:DNA-binding CsgD family transcriptional regulator
VAVALDAAAVHAHGRNAPDAAAQLSEQAALLTEATDPQRARRMAAAGRYLLVAGDLGRARGLLERALAEPAAAEGPPRAELLYRLAFVRELMDDFEVSEQLGHDALQHAGDDVALTVRIKLLLAGTAFITGRNWSSGANHALEALQLAEQLGDREILAAAMGPYISWRYATGHAYDPSVLRRADALEPWMRRLRVLDQAEFDVAGIEFAEGEPTAASRFSRLLERAERDGDYSSLPFLLGIAALGDQNAGRVDLAHERIDRSVRLALTTEQGTALVHARASEARLEARLGNADGALTAGREALKLIETTKWRAGMWAMLADLALLELSRDRPAAALEFVIDSISPSAPDQTGRGRWLQVVAAEVLVALGRHDEARSLLARLDAKVTRDGSRRLFAEVLRARARLAAATGDLDAAESAIWEAEAIHRRMEDRWEIARTLLVAGEIHRRARRRAKARKALTEALELFELLGARLWAAQAREQLGRIGAGRAEGDLTATQREVAELVAEGLTNRQVADRLFMSPHTVEAHLTTIYRTLGIGSRLEISAALARKRTPRDSAAEIRDSRSAMPGED